MATTTYPIETNNGTATTWVPLTTTFSAPQSCTTIFRDIGVSGGTRQAYDPNYSSLDNGYSCVAAPVSVWWSQYSETAASYTTKIGIGPLICPHNWSAVQTSVKSGSSTFSMCCPSGYDRSNGANAQAVVNLGAPVANGGNYGQACVSTVTPGQVIRVYISTGVTQFTVQKTNTVFALGVVGLNIGSATSSSSGPASTGSMSASATGSGSTTTTDGDESSGLSTGAKAGIGVGVAIAVLALIGLAVFFVLRSKKKRKHVNAPQDEKADAPAYESAPLHETAPLHEKDASSSYIPKAELDASQHGKISRGQYELE